MMLKTIALVTIGIIGILRLLIAMGLPFYMEQGKFAFIYHDILSYNRFEKEERTNDKN